MSAATGAINLHALPPEQLLQLEKQQKGDIENLTQNYTVLRAALTKYQQSLDALVEMQTAEVGSEILVPLTGSMYVPGRIKNADRVLVELGTGYFVEKKLDSAEAFLKKKLAFLQKSLDQLTTVIVTKKKQQNVVSQVIQQRVQQMQQQQQAQQIN